MVIKIDLEDLAANALIEQLKYNNKREITYKKLEEYGEEVVSLLKEKNIKANLVLGRNKTDKMLEEHQDFFEEKLIGSTLGTKLKDGISEEDLINKFRGYLLWEVLLAFTDKRACKVLYKEN